MRECAACPHPARCRLARRCALPRAARSVTAPEDDIPDPVRLAQQVERLGQHQARGLAAAEAQIQQLTARLDVVERRLAAACKGWKVLR